MADPKSALTPDFKSKDPYGYLAGVAGYQLPQEWIDNMQVPELHATRILASYDEPGFKRGGDYMTPIFLDPEYDLLSLAERKFIGVIGSSVNACPTCLVIHP